MSAKNPLLKNFSVKPQPDFNRFLKAVRRQGEPGRVPFIELLADPQIKSAVLGEHVKHLYDVKDQTEEARLWDQEIRFWHTLGYDYVPVFSGVVFSYPQDKANDTAALSKGERAWVNEATVVIKDRQDFDAYPWPDPEKINLFRFEYLSRNLPPGMKVLILSTGVFENTRWLLGFEGLSYGLVDNPELVADVFRRVGEIFYGRFRQVLDRFDVVGGLFPADDMGFRSSTLVSPKVLREHVLPWHKKIAALAHGKGMPYILHSCGNLEGIMDDLIDDVKIDARHSFEDAIMPVEEAKRKHGKRIGIMGGIDMNIMGRGSVDEVRERVRKVLKACAPGGGYCLGSGNSIANYVKVENFLAMLDEGWKRGTYPIR